MDLAAPGGVNAPAETSTADVTAVFGMISSVRLEHVGAAVITVGTRDQAAHRNNLVKELVTFARLLDAQRQKNFDRRIPHLILGGWLVVTGLILTGIGYHLCFEELSPKRTVDNDS